MNSMTPSPAAEEAPKEATLSLRVSFMGIVTSFTGTKELTLDLPEGATLRQLLDDLEQRYGPEFGQRVYRNARPPRALQMCTRIFINEIIVGDEALDEAIPLPQDGGPQPEVLVYILPAATGG